MFDMKKELKSLLDRYLANSIDLQGVKKEILAMPRRENSAVLTIRDRDDEIFLARIFEYISEVAPISAEKPLEEGYSLSETEFRDWLEEDYGRWEKGTVTEQDWP